MRATSLAAEPRHKALRLVAELAREGRLEIPVAGRSMEPLLAAGQRATVEPARLYWPGDVIAFHTSDGRLLLHRFLGYLPTSRGLAAVAQADAAPGPDAPVPPAAILGRLAEIDGRAAAVPGRERLRSLGRFSKLLARALRRRLFSPKG